MTSRATNRMKKELVLDTSQSCADDTILFSPTYPTSPVRSKTCDDSPSTYSYHDIMENYQQVQNLLTSIRTATSLLDQETKLIEIKHSYSLLLRLLRATPDLTAASIHKQHGESVVLKPMESSSPDSVVVCYISALVRKMCQFNIDSTAIMASYGVVSMATSALDQFPHDSILHASIIRCFSTLVHASELCRNQMMPPHTKTLDLILSSLAQHQTYSNVTRHIQIYACQLLKTLCEYGGESCAATIVATKDEEMSPGVLLLHLLRQSTIQRDTKLMCSLTTLLLCLISYSVVVVEQVRACHGMLDLSIVMSMFPMDPGIVRHSTSALRAMATSPKSQHHSEITPSSTRPSRHPTSPKRSTTRSVSPRRVNEIKPIRRYDFTSVRAGGTYTSRETHLKNAYGVTSATRRPCTSTKEDKTSTILLVRSSSGQLLPLNSVRPKVNRRGRSRGGSSAQDVARSQPFIQCYSPINHIDITSSRQNMCSVENRRGNDEFQTTETLTSADRKTMGSILPIHETQINEPNRTCTERVTFTDKLHKMIEMAGQTMNNPSQQICVDKEDTYIAKTMEEPILERSLSCSKKHVESLVLSRFSPTGDNTIAFLATSVADDAIANALARTQRFSPTGDNTIAFLATIVANDAIENALARTQTLSMSCNEWKRMSENVSQLALSRVLHVVGALLLEKCSDTTEEENCGKKVEESNGQNYLPVCPDPIQEDENYLQNSHFLSITLRQGKSIECQAVVNGEMETKVGLDCIRDEDVTLSECEAIVAAQAMAETFLLRFNPKEAHSLNHEDAF